MKTYFIPFIALLLSASSCNRNSDSQTHKAGDIDTLKIRSDSTFGSAPGFNLDQVPVSTSEVGEFPYLTAPSGYRYADGKEKTLEEKYFFYNDSLVRKVSGQYYYTAVFKDVVDFEDTYLISEYKKAIEKLGGVEFYSGGLPASASELLDKDQPAYISDMYDPHPYKYKQFLIRTPKENIWIELCHGLNANQVDLTVLREAVTN